MVSNYLLSRLMPQQLYVQLSSATSDSVGKVLKLIFLFRVTPFYFLLENFQ